MNRIVPQTLPDALHYRQIDAHAYEALPSKRGAYTYTNEDGQRWYLVDGKAHREDGPALVYADGTCMWYHKGECHRIGAPAVCTPEGYEQWYLFGLLHREDGPAVVDPRKAQREWWFRGMRHRVDGPAVERANGMQWWWYEDTPYPMEEHPGYLRLQAQRERQALRAQTPQGRSRTPRRARVL